MIALFGLLELMQIGVELLLRRPGSAVDALQLRAVDRRANRSPPSFMQLERFADLARRGHVRAAAEVEPFALAVDFQVLALGDRVDEFDLEALALGREKILGLCALPHLFREGLVLRDDLVHPLLDLGEIVRA